MTSVMELSNDSQELLSQVVEESDHISGDDSLDTTVQHLCKSYLIGGGNGDSDELSQSEREEIEQAQADLRENIIENL